MSSVTSPCLVCMSPVPEDAAICTACESWQFGRRRITRVAKFALFLLAPLAAWLIASMYQHQENIRSSTQASITGVTEQMADVIEMNKEFQLAFDSLTTNCDKEAQTASNLCLATYVSRIHRINELVSRLSWKSGVIPMQTSAVTMQTKWKSTWWGSENRPGMARQIKQALVAMAKDDRLKKCQELDFEESDCGKSVTLILQPFRDQTTDVMCAFSMALRSSLLALYSSLPTSEETSALIDNIRARLQQSYCADAVRRQEQALAPSPSPSPGVPAR